MPADPSSSESPEEASLEEAQPEPMSRAERRAAARGKTIQHDAHPWNNGKVGGARGAQATRRQYSNRRSGG